MRERWRPDAAGCTPTQANDGGTFFLPPGPRQLFIGEWANLVLTPPTPFRIGKRPPALKKKRPAIKEPRGGGHRQNFQLLDAAQKNKTPDENATVEVNVVVPHGDGGAPDLNGTPHGCEDR